MENKIEILKDEQVLYSTEKFSVVLILFCVIIAIFFFVVGILLFFDSGFVVAVAPFISVLLFLLYAYYLLLRRRYDKMIVTNKGLRWTQMKKNYFIEWKDIRTCELYGMIITKNNGSRCKIDLQYTKFDSMQICEAINKAYAEYEARIAQMKGLQPANGSGQGFIDYEKFTNKRMFWLIFRVIVSIATAIYAIYTYSCLN